MPTEIVFLSQLIMGYLVWLAIFNIYLRPRIRTLPRLESLRAIAALHSFRFFGLVFILPGVVGQHLPPQFATYAAYLDFTTGVLAWLSLLSFKRRAVFVSLVVAFNGVGTADLIIDYWHAVQGDLPRLAGELGASYVIPIVYVPALMITHVLAFYLLVRAKEASPVAA